MRLLTGARAWVRCHATAWRAVFVGTSLLVAAGLCTRLRSSWQDPINAPLYVIGRSMFETDGIPRAWAQECNTWVDEVRRYSLEGEAPRCVLSAVTWLAQHGSHRQSVLASSASCWTTLQRTATQDTPMLFTPMLFTPMKCTCMQRTVMNGQRCGLAVLSSDASVRPAAPYVAGVVAVGLQ